MRILVLTSDAFGGYGGIARYNEDLLAALCSHPRCSEVVALPRYIREHFAALPERLTYRCDSANNKLKYGLAALDLMRIAHRFDLVFCAHIHLLPLAYPLHLRFRAPLVLLAYGFDAWDPTGRPITDGLARRVDAVISISARTQEGFRGWANIGKHKEFILPAAVDLERFTPGATSTAVVERYHLSGKKVLLTVARLAAEDRYKGIDETLELFPSLAAEIPNLVYLIIGDGTDRARLEQKARDLDVENRVIFAGMVPESEKVDHYRAADVFVMPGKKEGFGIVYLEAAACGVPVVASKADGSREAMRDGMLGILVDPDDHEDIRRGILRALRTPKGTVPPGLDYFSSARFTERCHAIVDELMRRHSPDRC